MTIRDTFMSYAIDCLSPSIAPLMAIVRAKGQGAFLWQVEDVANARHFARLLQLRSVSSAEGGLHPLGFAECVAVLKTMDPSSLVVHFMLQDDDFYHSAYFDGTARSLVGVTRIDRRIGGA
jgi:hypothetical protein